ncbi:MAG: NapC/NirT family cytochrome c [Deltaproteobacteria bacterium]|nr:NapC/NirT family cytochrome c [Deltaproteobacteria bacterium]
MSKKAYILVSIVTFAASMLIFKGISYTSHKVNTSPGTCNICHSELIKYNFDDYKGNLYSRSKVTSGASIGCAECHPYPFREYQKSTHYMNRSGVRPGCMACHEPHSLFNLIRFKFLYLNTGTQGDSLFHNITGVVMDKEKWEKRRVELAKKVREGFLATDSAKCRNCHVRALIVSKKAPVMRAHKKIESQGKTCIDCHYNLVHAEVPWGEEDKDEESAGEAKD